MIDIKNRVKSVSDREQWAARRGGFMAKVTATKLVWFPPKPVETTGKVASAAREGTRRAAKKSTGAAKKATGAAKKGTRGAAKGTSGAARKTTGAARKTTGTDKKT
jgi:hypothetical protein